MRAPTYQPKQDLLELYSESGGENNDTIEANGDIYQNQELWSCFKEKNWKKYSLQEKVAADSGFRSVRFPLTRRAHTRRNDGALPVISVHFPVHKLNCLHNSTGVLLPTAKCAVPDQSAQYL